MCRFLWVLIISIVLVIGCSSDEDPEDKEDETPESTRLEGPPSLYIRSDYGAFHARLDKSCWEADKKKPCNLSPSDPKEVFDNSIGGEKSLFATPGEQILLKYNNMAYDVPFPDKITLHQFDSKEDKGMEVEVLGANKNEMRAPEIRVPKIQAPKEPGKYYYSVQMEWTDEMIAEVFYVFYFFVREEAH